MLNGMVYGRSPVNIIVGRATGSRLSRLDTFAEYSRHFQPFRLFRPRRFRRLPLFSLQFDDLRRHKFGTGLAIIASAGKHNAEDLDPRYPELPLLSD